MKFKMRTTKPVAGNKYYTTKANGGYSYAIKGSPTDKDCDVLANCVGYAYGRFNEIGGYGCCKYLSPVNAENFLQFKGGLESGQTPRLGACMVWQKGATLNGSDGAGHVAIVEKVISDTQVMTSESAYGGAAFTVKTRQKGSNGKWGMSGDYKFLGFIYNPAPCCQIEETSATNAIYRSLGTAAKRKGADQTAIMSGRCEKGAYYLATQIVTSADGRKWFKHIGSELFSALTDTPSGGNAKLFEQAGTYTKTTTNATVNARAVAGLSGKVIAKLNAGTEIYLTDTKPQAVDGLTWVEIIYNGKPAWCDKQWISV